MKYLLTHAIEETADRLTEQTAFRFEKDSISYGEFALNVRRLANFLVEQGVAKGDRVGIFRRKGIPSALAVYGIMAAGAAYVPLDPMMPLERLRAIVEDCGIRDLVSENSQVKTLSDLVQDTPLRTLVGLEGESAASLDGASWSQVIDSPDHMPKVCVMEQDLAYIMYTSGSTGQPKGLAHTHYSGLSYATMAAETYGVTNTDKIANHSSLHFDMSTFDYFSGPLGGATTIIISEQCTKFPANMSRLIEDEGITIWYSVPWALIQLLQFGALEKRNLGSLRWVMFGGEPFPSKHLRDLMQALPGARFSNVYGPAEVNQCTYYHLSEPPAIDDDVPIGKIWANADGMVVDERDQLTPSGEVGELLVRTPTMMRGYWARPDLNQKVFHHSLGPGGLEQIYLRTGDLVREDSNGSYVFVGRKDRQVKIRGYRVELDEIEAALCSLEGVMEAAVVSVFDGQATNHVKAAVTLKPGVYLEQADMLAHAKQKIPSYAIPEQIAVVKDFPRTTSGKIDRRELRTIL